MKCIILFVNHNLRVGQKLNELIYYASKACDKKNGKDANKFEHVKQYEWNTKRYNEGIYYTETYVTYGT